jgi:putative hemolysin
MLWMDDSMEDWDKTIRSCRHTNYPVCGETVDTVVGVLNSKDYFALDDRGRESVMESAVKPAYFVPAAVKADVLFRNMKATRNSFAIVLDE